MKPNPSEPPSRHRLESHMLSLDGFLGDDARPLAEIIAVDRSEVMAAGLEVEALGRFLEELHRAADAGWEGRVAVFGGAITVRADEALGQIPCPFHCATHCHKAVIRVKDRAGNDLLEFTPLDAHLIQKHSFFQGRGSHYRIEPRALIELYKRCIQQGEIHEP